MLTESRIAGFRDWLEHKQVAIYFISVVAGSITALVMPGTTRLESSVNPALALMLYVTFLQVPVVQLGSAFTRWRFLLPLLLTNFVAVPLLVAVLVRFLPENPMLLLGVLLVLLTPCIDYVVTFAQLGRADSRLLLASTPVLLIVQLLMLPVYLHLFLGEEVSQLVQPEPFIHAFIWLIAIPLILAAFTQLLARRIPAVKTLSERMGLLPVPATALVLFIVVAAMLPQLGKAWPVALQAVPVYVVFAISAPFCGWGVATLFRLEPTAGRAVAFSGATRNSLVILPLALVVPDAVPVMPAVIVAQTMVELLGELIYIRLIPGLGRERK
ncbi:arsenic resistance protein [Morganella morganii]|uniref:arsenic resistance protein n=1 Tax=Morganella morganii TaxID=582 RepID=UPI000F7BE848|nr:arsenic resistance protein [Morganella morganii]AZP26256.1 arsenic resistance protein [Morganella morganii]ELW9227061.1 arsenic resistance protein [Morganella morganii]